MTEEVVHAVSDEPSDADVDPLPHAENDGLRDPDDEPVGAPETEDDTDGVRQGIDDAEKDDVVQPLEDCVALRECEVDPVFESDPVALPECVRLRRDDVEPVGE